MRLQELEASTTSFSEKSSITLFSGGDLIHFTHLDPHYIRYLQLPSNTLASQFASTFIHINSIRPLTVIIIITIKVNARTDSSTAIHLQTSKTMSPTFPIMNVATEIQLLIIGNLNPLDRICLKLTNHYFYQIIDPLTPAELPKAQQLLYQKRGYDRQKVPGSDRPGRFDCPLRPYLACMTCSRLRLSSKFSDDQQRASPVLRVPPRLKRSLGHLFYTTRKRFCITCGLGARHWVDGDTLEVEEKLYQVCRSCHKLKETCKGTRSYTMKFCRHCYLNTLKVSNDGASRRWLDSYGY